MSVDGRVRVAACQLKPASEVEERQAQMQFLLEEAEGVDFICFPEGFLTGYYAQEEPAFKSSLEAGMLENWLEITKRHSATIIAGFNERSGDKIFDSAAIIENGKLIGVQRKHYLYHSYFSSGASFTPFQSKGVAFGVAICLDMNYFEPARLLALQGATIIFSPMCNLVPSDHPYAKRPSYYSHFVARSFENRCWVVTADWVGQRDGGLTCPGHSVIYDPDGAEVSRSKEGKEELLIFDIPFNKLHLKKGRRVHGSPALCKELSSIDGSGTF